MKKILFFAALAAITVACQKTPSVVDKDGEYLVYTNYDKDSDFSAYTTYNIPDSILVIGNSRIPEYAKGGYVDDLVDSYKEMMDACGYTYVEDRDAADLGIQISYILNTEYFVGYVSSTQWWLGYPGYWSPGYWGYWDSWYYGYPVTYSYSTHSLLTDIVDLTSDEGEGQQLSVLWTSFINGESGYSTRVDALKFRTAIEQSFAQSEYLDINK